MYTPNNRFYCLPLYSTLSILCFELAVVTKHNNTDCLPPKQETACGDNSSLECFRPQQVAQFGAWIRAECIGNCLLFGYQHLTSVFTLYLSTLLDASSNFTLCVAGTRIAPHGALQHSQLLLVVIMVRARFLYSRFVLLAFSF